MTHKRFPQRTPGGSTRVCRMETCKDHPHTGARMPHTSCTSQLKPERRHTASLTTQADQRKTACQHVRMQGRDQTAGRCLTHKRFPQRTPGGSTRVCRMETCKDHPHTAARMPHTSCTSQLKQQKRHTASLTTQADQHRTACQHVRMQGRDQTAGRCLTHKRFPQRTPGGSTRVCRMETCKDHPHTAARMPHTSCTSQLKPERQHADQHRTACQHVRVQGRDQTAGRCLTHKRFPQRTPGGSTRVCRMETCEDQPHTAARMPHTSCTSQLKQERRHTASLTTQADQHRTACQHVRMQGRDQTAGRCLTHKRFPQRTPGGSTRVCRMETCKDHPHTAARMPHTSCTSQLKQERRHTASLTTQADQRRTACQHVRMQGRDQTAGRCLTHKRFPQRTPGGSTRVCRMETCKDHPHTAARMPHTSCTSQLKQERRHTASHTTQADQRRTACQHVRMQGRDQTAGRCLTHKRFPQRTPGGSTRVCRMETCKDHPHTAARMPHTSCTSQLKPERQHTASLTTQADQHRTACKHVRMQGRDQTAGRCLTHKRFPQRTPGGSTRVCRMETCKDHPHTAARMPHASCTSQLKQERRHTASLTTQADQRRTACHHVRMQGRDQTAGRCLTHKRFPQRTPGGSTRVCRMET